MSLREIIAADQPQSGPPGLSRGALGVGLVGLGRTGRHHLERLSLRSDIRVAALYDRARTSLPDEHHGGSRLHASWKELLDDDHVELVLIAAPPRHRCRLAVEALDAGKHALVESPLCATSAELEAMFAAAQRANRVLSVSTARSENDDFRTAMQVALSGDLGQITSARLMIWEFGVGGDDRTGRAAQQRPWRDVPEMLLSSAAHYVDQLLKLVAASPSSVFTDVSRDGVSDGRPAYSVILNFSDGQTGLVEIHLASLASVNTGWVLEGTRGAYRNSCRYTLTDAGEIFDLPMEAVPAEWNRCYDALLSELKVGRPVSRSAVEGGRTVRVLEAAAESAGRHEVVTIANGGSAEGI